jgi:hypothetical protein
MVHAFILQISETCEQEGTRMSQIPLVSIYRIDMDMSNGWGVCKI